MELVEITKDATLGFYNGTGLLKVPVKQFDNARKIRIMLIDDTGEEYKIPEDIEINFKALKPDKTQINTSEVIEVSDNRIIVSITDQITVVDGIVHCEIILHKDGKRITTTKFDLIVESSVHDNSHIEESADYNDILDTIGEVKLLVENYEKAKADIDDFQKILEENENERISNEETRQNQETERESKTQEAIDNANMATQNTNDATDHCATVTRQLEDTLEKGELKAQEYYLLAESHSHGGTGIREGEDKDNSKYYYEQAKRISQGLEGSLLPMGTVTFAELGNQSKNPGYMYNISDDFTTTAEFKEGAGYEYPAGTNVYRTADGFWDCLAGTAVTTVNGETGNVLVTPAKIGAPTKEEAYLLKGGMGIQEGSDMNGYKTPGNYACGSNAIARTLLNSPTNGAFTLKVDYGAGTSYPRQTYRGYVSGKTFVRVFDPYSGTSGMWTEYKEVPFKDELTATNTKATDTHALLGTAGADSTVQALIDAIADRVIDKLLPRDGSKPMTGQLEAPEGISIINKFNDTVDIDGGLINLHSNIDSTSVSASYISTPQIYLEQMMRIGGHEPGNFLDLLNSNGKLKINGHNSEGNISEVRLLDERDIIDSFDSTATDKVASANCVRQLNQDMDGLKPGFDIIVSDGMTDGQIDELVRSAFSGGIRRLRIYNDKTNYKFGHIGNFNIWIYGNDAMQGNGIAIDHWSGHVFSFRIAYPDGAILVSRLVDENMLSTKLGDCLQKNGESQLYNPISDLNSFYTGIGLFSASTLNLPEAAWHMVVSAGVQDTVSQRAYRLMDGTECWRYCSAGSWSIWNKVN